MKIQNIESLWRKKSKSQSAGGSCQCILPPISSICHSFQITVGSTGRYYEVGRRGAIKTEEALRKILAKDIASGYFGEYIIPEIASQIVNIAVEAFEVLVNEEQ